MSTKVAAKLLEMCSLPILLLMLASGQYCLGSILLQEEPNVLTPPYFNIATGKKIEATATCGETGQQRFCKLTGGPNEARYGETLEEGAYCDICDSSNPSKSHPIRYAIDGTEKWWQSPPLSQGNEYNKINITIHLGQVYHVAYTLVKFANSPRAGTWVLERSSDHGKTFHPWQYFASTDSDCINMFGIDPYEEITRDDSVICTSRHSSVVPLERGEVIVSMVNHRPGANNFSHSRVLQEWTRATDIRLRLLRTKTLLAHLMAVQTRDPTVTRRYYYSIKDISIGGRCVCHGHADTCLPDENDRYKLVCQCRHHTCGQSCERCCPGFVQKAWRVAVPESSNECEECNCHGHSTECYYDEEVAIRRQSLDRNGEYEGGGVCQNCSHNTAGINCEKCMDGYYRPIDVDLRDPDGCRPCECNSSYTVGTCEPFTGRCYCKPQYDGDRCDRCAPGYRNFPECEPCPCNYNGTRNGVCEPGEDGCPCKYNFGGMYCNECQSGFYDFPDCIACQCPGRGALDDQCDAYTGQCNCDIGFSGLLCDKCAPGYYNYPNCLKCMCHDRFTTSEICDATNGTCFCTGLATGESCEQCIPGYFDFPHCRECGCSREGSLGSMCDHDTGKCDCKPNYGGLSCDECAPEYFSYPSCIPCNCNLRGSSRTTCDSITGECFCRSFITGRQCDQCSPQYFNFPRCEDCKCDPRGIKEVQPGVCLAFTVGQCDCKDHVVGMYCNECDPLHYDLSQGCVDCNCYLQGTLDGVAACNPDDGNCWCKTYAGTQRCSHCEPGFYGLSEANYFACTGCQCDRGGSLSDDCDPVDGQCLCKPGLTGQRCNKVVEGYFSPTILQYQFEVENGRSPDGEILRFGFDQNAFPGFSDKGYAEFSYAQYKIVVPITVYNRSNGLYHVYVHYMQPVERSVGNITFNPITAEGSSQSVEANFDVTVKPTLLSVGNVFVFTPGQWEVEIEGKPGLLVDYVVLIPSEYYEASVLQAKIIQPCKPRSSTDNKECILYTHPPLHQYLTMDLTENVDSNRLASPLPDAGPLVMLEGQSILGYNEYDFIVTPQQIGKYVLVLEYTSDCEHMHTIEATVTNGQEYGDVKFNVYTCEYAFLCRQVALSPSNEVMVFDISFESAEVHLSVDPEETAYISRVFAIPFDEWTMEYVEPKRRCIIIEGSDPNDCIPWKYPIAETGKIFEVDAEDGDRLLESAIANVNARYLSDNETIRIDMNLTPGRYVFLLHYFNPEHISFNPAITVVGGVVYQGSANVTHCPSMEGCRAVVTAHDGAYVLDITAANQIITITVPAGKAFWLDYIVAIPQKAYRASFLDFSFYDYSRKFFQECYGIGTDGLIELANNPSEFCLAAAFTLTTSLNDGAMICECSELGTIGGAKADCQAHGGQCPCKEHVIGRTCEKCKIGFHGFPDCQACDCNGLLCDELNGNCICPPNTQQPDCKQCAPFSHSYHPLAGCVACDCVRKGVNDSTNLGCSVETGQCQCKENVEGLMCDRCKPGYFAFPECRPCVCNTRGSKSEVCDAESGQCKCKDNVQGQRCDQCKPGTFDLYGNNPVGCTSCFCFGAISECSSTLYSAFEIDTMLGWTIPSTKIKKPIIREDYRSVSVEFEEIGGPLDSTRAGLYWLAPQEYLGKKIGSYGGTMSYIIGSEGSDSTDGAPPPAPLTGTKPHVILQGGGGFIVGWTNLEFKSNSYRVTLKILEANFIHQTTGTKVSREDMMMVLEDVTALRIKVTDDPRAVRAILRDVSFPTTDYSSKGNATTIPSVETCVCPKGYTGESCELCDTGFFRDTKGPYLGYCVQCDCFEHCEVCNGSGNLIQPDDCLHNTAGERCDVCKDGFIGDPKSGDPNACKICPCPFSTAEGSFAGSCEYTEDDGVICNCNTGYAGEHCEICDIGYYGNPAIIGGKCIACNCNGNSLYGVGYEPCDRLTGVCTDCKPGYGGKHCEICDDGFFGDAIYAKNCSACQCLECGTSHCDRESGQCQCQPHVMGEYCDYCNHGYYDLGSCVGCKACHCGLASTGFGCDDSIGKCECAPNVVGLKCNKCAEGHWDYSVNGCKPCDCGNIVQCNPVTGECKCPPGTKGQQCEQCELPRYIIPPGEILCQACGKCTSDLLDTIETFDVYIRQAADIVRSISTGVVARQRFGNFGREVEQIGFLMQRTNRMFAALETFFNIRAPDIGMFSETLFGSGSGMEELGSGNFEMSSQFFNEQSFTSVIDASLQMVETTVTGMCNVTQFLLDKVESTASQTMVVETKSDPIMHDLDLFHMDALNFIEDLNQEASGEEIEFQSTFNEVMGMLTKMQLRRYAELKTVGENEIYESNLETEKVNEAYSLPARNLNQQTEELRSKLTEKESKLQVIRKRLNSVRSRVLEIQTLNKENKKNIDIFENSFQALSTLREDALDLISDSKRLVNRRDNATRLQVMNSESLINEFIEFERYRSLINSETLKNLTGRAEKQMFIMQSNADELIALINMTVEKNAISRTINSTRRYSNLIKSITNANNAALEARMAAHTALQRIEDGDIENVSKRTMLDVKQINSYVAQTTVYTDNIEDDLNALISRLSTLKFYMEFLFDENRLLRLQAEAVTQVNMTVITAAKTLSAEADEIAAVVTSRTDELEKQIREAPPTDFVVRSVINEVKQSFTITNTRLAKATKKLQKVRDQADQVEQVRQNANFDDKIKAIKRLIDRSRDVAGSATVSMKFKAASGDAVEYVQPRLPSQVTMAQDYARIELYVNVSTRPDNAIMYWGDTSSKSGDYMALETQNGYLHYKFRIGRRTADIVSVRPINNDDWHKVAIQRIGNFGEMRVESRNPNSSVLQGQLYLTNVTSGSTNGKMKIILPNNEATKFIVGGIPSDIPTKAFQSQDMEGCIKGLVINGEPIGLWNFISYGGPKPGLTCEQKPSNYPVKNEMWKFSGGNSYLRIKDSGFDVTENRVRRITIVQFKFSTLQSDALLFFIGNSRDQFFALEIRGGKYVITCNFGWDRPKQEVVHKFPDVNTNDRALVLKFAVVRLSAKTLVILASNSELGLSFDFTVWSPNITGDAWIGGILSEHIPDGVEDDVQNIRVNFRGCMGRLAFDPRRLYNIFNVDEKLGVTRGCNSETVVNFEVQGADYVVFPLTLPSVQEISGFLTIRTESANGSIAVAKQQSNSKEVTLAMNNGIITLNDGETQVHTEHTYNDGQPHTIVFKRNSDCSLRLNVDDDEILRADGSCMGDEEEEEYEQVRRGRESASRRESLSKMSVFAASPVLLYLGGSKRNFTGCIANIQIFGDERHPGLLTSNMRCGFSGNVRCFGKPKFNKCNMQARPPQESVGIVSTIIQTQRILDFGDTSADTFTNGTMLEVESSPGKRKNKRRKIHPGPMPQFTPPDIGDIPQGLESRGDCFLTLRPENTGVYYPGDGYSKYTIQNLNSFDWRFSMYFRTIAKEGILFFLCGADCSEHIALYMVKGKLMLKVKFADESQRIRTERKYNDGNWHLVTFQRKGLDLQLRVDETIYFSEVYELSSTFSEVLFFYIGGLQATERIAVATYIHQEYLRDFEGCIRNLVVNDVHVGNTDSSSALLYKLNVRTCFEGHTEPGIFFSDSSPFEDGSYLVVYDSYNVGSVLQIDMEIRPRSQSGVLFAIGGDTGNFFQLTLIDGKVVARIKQGSDVLLMSIYDPSHYGESICDGNWHKVNVVKSKNMLSLTVDGNLAAGENIGTARKCHTNGPLYMGGVPRDASVGKLLSDRRQYTGCMRNVFFDFYKITTSIAIEVMPGVSDSCPASVN